MKRFLLTVTYPLNRIAFCALWTIGMLGCLAFVGCDWLERGRCNCRGRV